MSGWTISHQISEQAAIDLMRSQLKRPAAIIVIGGNNQTTEKVTAALGQSVGSTLYAIHELTGMADVSAIRDDAFMVDHFLFVNLVRGSSSAHGFRHQVVQRLRTVGAKSIAIVWVKGNPARDNLNANAVDEELREHPPTVDGIDYLFTLEP